MSWAVLVQIDGSYSTLSSVAHGDIALSMNTIQLITKNGSQSG